MTKLLLMTRGVLICLIFSTWQQFPQLSTALMLFFEASNHSDSSDKLVDKVMVAITVACFVFCGCSGGFSH